MFQKIRMEELVFIAAGTVIIDGKYSSFKLNFERNIVIGHDVSSVVGFRVKHELVALYCRP